MGKNQAVEKAEYFAESIGRMAYQALLEEVYTVPKPGLVDPYSCGAHTDMDVQTFERSAEALYPWFVRMAYQGYQLTCTPEDLFREIRKTGMLAEEAMYRATGHVNTHKGMIFTLGIFSAAAGRCIQEDGTVTLQSILRMEQKMTARILRAEIEMLGKEPAKSNGEKNLVQYGTTGIRGEALAGYPSVFHIALPVLEDGLLRGMEWNRIKLQILFALMSRVQDSNILSRGESVSTLSGTDGSDAVSGGRRSLLRRCVRQTDPHGCGVYKAWYQRGWVCRSTCHLTVSCDAVQ